MDIDSESKFYFDLLQSEVGNSPKARAQYVGRFEKQPYELLLDVNESLFYLCRFNLMPNTRYPAKGVSRNIVRYFSCTMYSKPVNYSAVEYTLTQNYIVAVANAPYLYTEEDDTKSNKYHRQYFLFVWDKQDGNLSDNQIDKKWDKLIGYSYRLEKLQFGLLSSNIVANEIDPEHPKSSKLSDVISIHGKSGVVTTIRLGKSAKIIKTKKDNSTANFTQPRQDILDMEVRLMRNLWAKNSQRWKLNDLFSPSSAQIDQRMLMEKTFLIGLSVLLLIMAFYCCHLFSVTKKANLEKAVHVQYRKKMIKVNRPNHLSVIEEFEKEDQDESYGSKNLHMFEDEGEEEKEEDFRKLEAD